MAVVGVGGAGAGEAGGGGGAIGNASSNAGDGSHHLRWLGNGAVGAGVGELGGGDGANGSAGSRGGDSGSGAVGVGVGELGGGDGAIGSAGSSAGNGSHHLRWSVLGSGVVGAGVGEVANGVVGEPNGLKPGGGFNGLVLGVFGSELSEALSIVQASRCVFGERIASVSEPTSAGSAGDACGRFVFAQVVSAHAQRLACVVLCTLAPPRVPRSLMRKSIGVSGLPRSASACRSR